MNLKVILFSAVFVIATVKAELYNFKTGNGELVSALNAALYELETSGQLEKAYFKYVGSSLQVILDSPRIASNYATPTPSGTLAQILERETIRIGFYDFNEPWQLVVGASGYPDDGYMVWVMNQLIETLNEKYEVQLSVEWVQVEMFYPDLLDGLVGARYDIVISQISKNSLWNGVARDTLVNFTNSYTATGQSFAYNSNVDIQSIASVYDFNAATYTVAVVRGSSANDFATANLPLATVVQYDDVISATYAVATKVASVVLDDTDSIAMAVKQYPNAIFGRPYTTLEGQAIAGRLDDLCGEWCPVVNNQRKRGPPSQFLCSNDVAAAN